MVKFNSNKIIINMISLYIFILFFYGIIIKFTIWNPTIFALKTYIPEAILILCTIFSIVTNKIRLNYRIILLFLYSVFIIVINYIFNGANIQSFYWWRDLFIPLFSSMILLQREFKKEDINYLFDRLIFIAKIFLILGLTLAIIEQIKGDVWTSKFYTGYVFYGQDPYSKVKIAHNIGLLRAPSLSGNFSSFAHYSCLSLFFILTRNKKKYKVDIFWIIIALLCCILSTNKSAIISLLVVLIIYKTTSFRKNNKTTNKMILIFIFSLIAFMLFLNSDSNFNGDGTYTGGLMERFAFWNNMIKNIDWLQVIVPYKTFLYGTGSEGFNSFFDNTYLYCFITQGIIGIVLWIYYLKSLYTNLKKNYIEDKLDFIKNVLYYFLIVSLTSNVIQGHAYFCFMIILYSILYKFEVKSSNFDLEKHND